MGRSRKVMQRIALEGPEDDDLLRAQSCRATKEYRRLLVEAGYIKAHQSEYRKLLIDAGHLKE